VLGTWAFVVLWVLLGFVVFFIAVRGGLRGARETFQSQTYGARRAARIGFTAVYIGFGIVIPALFLVGNHARASNQYAGIRLTTAEKQGRQLFGQHCGVCHTLAAANAVGKVGPNLDALQPTPTEALVLHTIQYGCLQAPPPSDSAQSCLGQGNMPAMVISSTAASDVAKFVAAVAGRE
jgi:mono/diheme cytochrome c family protein